MSRALANDIDYLIEKKENYVEKLKEEGKSTESIEIEMEILQKARDLILDCIVLSQENQNRLSELEQRERENRIKIARGEAVEAAFIIACIYKKDYVDKLAEIVYYPQRVIERLKMNSEILEQAYTELNFIEKHYQYRNIYARQAYKDLCEFAGVDYTKRATLWKNKGVKDIQLKKNIEIYIDKIEKQSKSQCM